MNILFLYLGIAAWYLIGIAITILMYRDIEMILNNSNSYEKEKFEFEHYRFITLISLLGPPLILIWLMARKDAINDVRNGKRL